MAGGLSLSVPPAGSFALPFRVSPPPGELSRRSPARFNGFEPLFLG